MEPDFIVARPMVAKVCYIDDKEEPKVSWFVLNDSNVETRRCWLLVLAVSQPSEGTVILRGDNARYMMTPKQETIGSPKELQNYEVHM